METVRYPEGMGTSRPTDSLTAGPPSAGVSLPPLELLKTVGDDTRYAILVAIADAAAPMTTAQLSEVVGLHANTIRPHLDRMREAGLVVREIANGQGVGRPRHAYRLAGDAPFVGDGTHPSLPAARERRDGSEPRGGLEALLVNLALSAGVTEEAAGRLGFEHGVNRAEQLGAAAAGAVPDATVDLLMAELERLGFGPRASNLADDDDDGEGAVRIDFMTCPFEDGTADAPDVACSLHAGIVAGLASEQPTPTDVTFVNRGESSSRRADCYARVAPRSPRYDSTTTALRSADAMLPAARPELTKE